MSEFKNVTVVKEANKYFGGAVTSRTLIFENGEKKTLGIMMPGEYEFGTAEKEVMEIMSGKLSVQLSEDQPWISIQDAFTFEVPANSKFKVVVEEVADYCCSYVKA